MKVKIRKIGFLIFIPIIMSIFGCAGSIRTNGVTKFDGYRDSKKMAILPTVYDNKTVAERMNNIHYKLVQPAIKQGYTVISVDQIENFLGKEFKELEKDPTNEKIINNIAAKFGIEVVLYCKVNEWQQDVLTRDRGGYFFNRVSLSYSIIDAKTLRPMAKISGSTEDTSLLNGDQFMDKLATHLAGKLIGAL
jgi:hypothetical protein